MEYEQPKEEMLTNREHERRNILKSRKPLAYEKAIHINDKFLKGEHAALISICYDYVCNMNCAHCSNSSFEVKDRHLTVADVKEIAKQAHELGLFQIELSGGEPLFFKELDDIIKAIDPSKFHINITTNGYLLDKKKAEHLQSIGVDKIKISVDCTEAELHTTKNGKNNAKSNALRALQIAKETGLEPIIQTVATRQNTQSKEMLDLAKYAKENEYTVDVVLAKPVGSWAGNYDILVNKDDIDYLRELNKEYPLRREVYPSYGIHKGCGTVKSFICITKYGDVLPCTFIPISIGNIFEEKLKDILDRGLRIKWFKNITDVCPAGQNRYFIDNYIAKCWGKPIPLSWKEIFTEKDFID
jgi:MoaA/NifB/PqqE/SkfB family radical SAM enzyme